MNEFDEFSTSTIGSAYFRKEIEIGDMKINYDIWDTAGQERFRTLTHSFYKQGHGIIIAFAVNDVGTFQSV